MSTQGQIHKPALTSWVVVQWIAFLRFCRPHTIIGTSLQLVSIFFVVFAGTNKITPPFLPNVISIVGLTWLGCLAANIYVVGLNQMTDVAIDRINKPTLPLASGHFSVQEGRVIVLVSGFLGLLLSAGQGFYLFLTVALIMLIGSAYSLPPLRLKQRPVWAMLSIAFARGVIGNLGLYVHFRRAFSLPIWPIPLVMIGVVLFFFGFMLVIALYKDIPDYLGDKKYQVQTFVVRLGQDRVFSVGRWLLTLLYLLPILYGFGQWPSFYGLEIALIHLVAIAIFWSLSWEIDPKVPVSMAFFYLFLWGLFYMEYLLLSLSLLQRMILS